MVRLLGMAAVAWLAGPPAAQRFTREWAFQVRGPVGSSWSSFCCEPTLSSELCWSILPTQDERRSAEERDYEAETSSGRAALVGSLVIGSYGPAAPPREH